MGRGPSLDKMLHHEIVALVRKLKIRIRTLEASLDRAKKKAADLKFELDTQPRELRTEKPVNAFGTLIRFRKKKMETLEKLIAEAGVDKDVLIGILNDYKNLKSGYGVVEKAVDSDEPGFTTMGTRRQGL